MAGGAAAGADSKGKSEQYTGDNAPGRDAANIKDEFDKPKDKDYVKKQDGRKSQKATRQAAVRKRGAKAEHDGEQGAKYKRPDVPPFPDLQEKWTKAKHDGKQAAPDGEVKDRLRELREILRDDKKDLANEQVEATRDFVAYLEERLKTKSGLLSDKG